MNIRDLQKPPEVASHPGEYGPPRGFRKGFFNKMGIHIGTSGWHYKHWLGPFFPTDFKPEEYLKFYADRFKTVELNNSFYHLPRETSLETWRKTVSKDFVFAVKASRFITHI